MKKIPAWMKLLTLLVFLIGVPTIACSIKYPSGSWKYKMTVTVETPDGIKTGSAVREVGYHTEPEILPPQGGTYHNVRHGEAVVVDLGERGVLFALLTGDAAYLVPMKHFPDAAKWTPNTRSEPVSLPRKDWPRFVTFEDMNDPTTVQQVLLDPISIEIKNDPYKDRRVLIEDTFGEGVSIKSVTIEMTDEDVTTGVVEYLPWLEKIDGGYLHGGSSSRGSPLGLHGGEFIRTER